MSRQHFGNRVGENSLKARVEAEGMLRCEVAAGAVALSSFKVIRNASAPIKVQTRPYAKVSSIFI